MEAAKMVKIAFVAVAMLAVIGAAGPGTAMERSPWGPAVNVGSIPGTSAEFNTPFTDGCPIQAPDGLSFYMASNRPGGIGLLDIWVSHRVSTDAPWGPPENLDAPVNSSADDFCPTRVRGNGLYFVSARAGGCGGPDIYVTRENPSHGWAEPRNLGCQVNSAAGEAGPSVVEAGEATTLFFSSTRPGGFDADTGASGDSDIYASVLGADGTFGEAVAVPGINTDAEDARPNVRKDGLEMVFDSTRPGSLGLADIYAATRSSASGAWIVPVNLGTSVNSASNESRASLSWDGMTLYFGSNRPGSELALDGITVSNDVYVATRERL